MSFDWVTCFQSAPQDRVRVGAREHLAIWKLMQDAKWSDGELVFPDGCDAQTICARSAPVGGRPTRGVLYAANHDLVGMKATRFP